MNSYSAPKLLRIAMSGEHIPTCPHNGSKIPGRDCKCWHNEVRKWDERLKLNIRKPKALKVHLLKDSNSYWVYCGKKKPQKTTTNLLAITCTNCLRWLNTPPKTKKKSKPSNLVHIST